MSQSTLILCGLVLSAIGFIIVYRCRSALTFLDLHIFFVCQYFGLLSVLDACLNDVDRYDSVYVFLVHFMVLVAVTLLAQFSRLSVTRRYVSFFSLKAMMALVHLIPLTRLRHITIILLTLHLVVTVTIIKDVRLINEDAGAKTLAENLPYWVTSALAIYRRVFFVAAIIGFLSALRSLKSRSWISVLDFIVFVMLIVGLSQFGRTYAMNAAFICLAAFLFGGARRIGVGRLAVYGLVSIAISSLFSNYYQTYRSGNNQDVTALAAIFNFEETVRNLRVRMPMWRYNYLIAEQRLGDDGGPDYAGQLSLQISSAAIPAVFVPNMKKTVGDALIADVFQLPIMDYPSNHYGTFLADFGIFSCVLLPFLVFSIIAIFYRICRFLLPRYPATTLFYFLFLGGSLTFIEGELVGVPILFRDAIVFGAIVTIWLLLSDIVIGRKARGHLPTTFVAR